MPTRAAIGAVLYEMLTGRKAFEGQSQANVISAIMSANPPAMATLQPLTTPMLERVVKTCLAKDPDARWQSAHDVKLELTWLVEGAVPPTAVSLSRNRERVVFAIGPVLLVTVILLSLDHFRRSPQPVQAVRASLLPHPAFFQRDNFSVSLDGTRLSRRC